jgi:hypothetical protein
VYYSNQYFTLARGRAEDARAAEDRSVKLIKQKKKKRSKTTEQAEPAAKKQRNFRK